MVVSLHAHQAKALEEMKNGCILKGGVGSGKSITALAYFYTKVVGGSLTVGTFGQLPPPPRTVHLYIITTVKKRDDLEWEHEALRFGLTPFPDTSAAGIIVTVDSWNKIAAYDTTEDSFFIFDEQRLVGSGAWVKSFLKIAKNNQWVLLSATPGDTWLDYIPVFVANGFYKNRTEFLREHVVFSRFAKYPKVERYVATGRLLRLRDSITVDMPLVRHTKRYTRDVLVDFDEELLGEVVLKRWNRWTERPIRDVGELFRLMRFIVNSDVSRLGEVFRVLEDHPRLIIFYNFDYELETLRTLHNVLGIPLAEWNGHKHEPVPDGDRWVYLVQYTAGSEGWNCITTNAILMYSLNYSWRVNEQVFGRIDRLNTPYVDLYCYRLISNSLIDRAILKAIGLKKDFNERKFVKSNTGFWERE